MLHSDKEDHASIGYGLTNAETLLSGALDSRINKLPTATSPTSTQCLGMNGEVGSGA